MSEITDEDAANVFDQIDTIGSLLYASTEQGIKTPLSKDLCFSGEQAEAMGSARHIADYIHENGGYSVETEYIEEVAPIDQDGERHKIRLTIEE